MEKITFHTIIDTIIDVKKPPKIIFTSPPDMQTKNMVNKMVVMVMMVARLLFLFLPSGERLSNSPDFLTLTMISQF